MATHSSILAWRIPGTGEPSGLPSMGSHRIRHNWSNLAAAAACPPQLFKENYSEFFECSWISISLVLVIRALLLSFGGVLFTRFFMILDSLHWYFHIWVSGLLIQTLKDCFETVLHQSIRLDFLMCLLVTTLDRWSLVLGSILEQSNCLSSEIGGWVCHWLRTTI